MPRPLTFESDLAPGSFGYELRRHRLGRGWSQQVLSERMAEVAEDSAGVLRQNQISSYERGENEYPRAEVLDLLDRVFEQPPGTFKGFTGYPPSSKEVRSRKVDLPPGSVVIPGTRPKLVEAAETIMPLEDDELQRIINLAETIMGVRQPARRTPARHRGPRTDDVSATG